MRIWTKSIRWNCIGGKLQHIWCHFLVYFGTCRHFYRVFFLSFEHSDTPHHLKNKRIQQGLLDTDAVSALLASAPKPSDYVPDIINIQPNVDNDGGNNGTGHVNDSGEFIIALYITHGVV